MRVGLASFLVCGVLPCSPIEEVDGVRSVSPSEWDDGPVSQSVDWPTNFEWLTGSEEDGRVWLYFGPDESDNIHAYFECRVGASELSVQAFDPSNEGTRLVLISGDVRGEFEATPRRDEDIYTGVKSQAVVPISSPVIAEFARTGILAAGEPKVDFRPASLEERGRIERFLGQCAGA